MRNSRKHQYLLRFSHIGDVRNLTFGSLWGSFFSSFLEPRFGKALGAHFDDFG